MKLPKSFLKRNLKKISWLILLLLAIIAIAIFIDEPLSVALYDNFGNFRLQKIFFIYSSYANQIVGTTIVLFFAISNFPKIREKLRLPKKFSKVSLLSTLNLIFTSALIKIIKELLKRERPYILLNLISIETANGYSFPSGHTGIAFSLTFPIIFEVKGKKAIKASLLIYSLLIAFSRIILFSHFLSDVLFSILLSYVNYKILKILIKSGKVKFLKGSLFF